jgi:adenylate cyclase
MRALLERVYRRLGPRYPRFAVHAVLQLAHVNVILGVVGLSLFVDMSADEFWSVLIVGIAGMFLYNLVYARTAFRLLAPVHAWLEGSRDRNATLEAWKTCASFPREMMRRDWASPLQGSLSYIGLLLWSAYFTWQLDLAAYTFFPLFAGIAVFILYLQSLRFFALENALRPVLDDIAKCVIDEADLHAPGLSLRTRLLTALPAINVFTGVVAVGITGAGHDLTLSDLGLAVLVASAIAATLSLALTLLLADSVAAPIAALRDATERVGRGDLAARVPVVTTDETGDLTRSFNEMATGLEQRERLRDAFGTFVDPALTQRVLEEGTDFAGEDVDLSLLFMDIRGFTSYSERADARDVVARLNDLYGQVVPAVLRHGGHANKFIGDGLLAVFGAPDRLHDHADRAVAAGLDIAAIVRERYRGELRVGIGINSGRVVVGTIGGGGRLDFTVIGDAVNTAARVESATRQTDDDLLITEATQEQLSENFGGWDGRPSIPLKGKTREVRLYAPRALSVAPTAPVGLSTPGSGDTGG